VHPETAIISFTTLLSKGKDVELEIVEGADHSFSISGDSSLDGWKFTLTKITDWFLKE
jgi:dipeptidyl aminopeptidase/acylaminoacyl peptidase